MTTRPGRGGRGRAGTTTSASRSPWPASARKCWPPGSAWSPGPKSSARAWSGRSGPTTRRSPRRSTRGWPTTLGQAELADAIQEGLEARKQGDEETATARLGRAVALAHQSGNEDTAKLLAKVVDVVDVESGTVRLKEKVEDADEMRARHPVDQDGPGGRSSTGRRRRWRYVRRPDDSASDDFCDTCGMRIVGHPPPGGPATGAPPVPAADPAHAAASPRNGQFCEACGHNFVGPRFTPTTAAAAPPTAPHGYSQSQPAPGSGGLQLRPARPWPGQL